MINDIEKSVKPNQRLFELKKPKRDLALQLAEEVCFLVNKSYIFISMICLTREFLAEWSCDGSWFDQRCLANLFKILNFGHAVVVDKIVVFFG